MVVPTGWLEVLENKDYPHYVARYAAAFAERYRPLVRWYTPLNEPIITALMCGMRGLWPPYLRGEKGYVRIMLQFGARHYRNGERHQGDRSNVGNISRRGDRFDENDPRGPSPLARDETHRGYVCFDLLTGTLSHDHLLFSWLLRTGAALDDLLHLQENKISLDILGMNFYPQWSTKQIYLDKRGRIAFREIEPEGGGFPTLYDTIINATTCL